MQSSFTLDPQLRKQVTDTVAALNSENFSGADMILACRKILWLWVRLGGESTDDPVIGFCGIESETDYLLGGSQSLVGRPVDHKRFEPNSAEEAAEIQRCYVFYRDHFIETVADLRTYLDGHPVLRSKDTNR